MRLRAICFLSLVMFVCTVAMAQPSDPCGGAQHNLLVNWTQFHSDPCHTGYNPHEVILGPTNVGNLVLDWTHFVPGDDIFYSPAVVNGVLYYGVDGDPTVIALDAKNGHPLWSQTSGSEFAGSPAVATQIDLVRHVYGEVYAASMSDIRALDAATGQVLWEQRDPFRDYPRPEITVANGAVYVASYHMGNYHTQHVYALDARTGAVLWTLSGDDWYVTTPAVANGMVYVACDPGSLCALDAGTGSLLWEYTTDGGPSPAAVADGVVYFSSWNNTLTYVYALNAATGELVWQLATLGSAFSTTPAVANGVVYIGTSKNQGGELYAADANTGALRWSYGTAGGIASPAVANGVVYFGSDNIDRQGSSGNVYALDADTGALLWKYDTESPVISSPAVVNGMLYVGSIQYMYAFHLPNQ